MVLCANICSCLWQKFGEGVMGRGIFLFSRDLAGHAPQQADWALRWHWTCYRPTQAQADSGACCTDEIETGVGADGLVYDTGMHTTHGCGKGDLGRAKSTTELPT